MKRISSFILVLFICQQSFAQPSKGSTLIGGSLQFNSTKNEQTSGAYVKSSNASFTPQVGKFIKDGLAIGVLAGWGNSSTKNSASNNTFDKSSINNYSLGFLIRKYYPLSGKWSLFGESTLTGTIIKGDAKTNATVYAKNSGWGTSINITPGIAFKAGKKLWLELALNNLANIGYSYRKNEMLDNSGNITNTAKTSSFNDSFSLSGFNTLAAGVRWIL